MSKKVDLEQENAISKELVVRGWKLVGMTRYEGVMGLEALNLITKKRVFGVGETVLMALQRLEEHTCA